MKKNNDQLFLLKNLILIDILKKKIREIYLKTNYSEFNKFIKVYSKKIILNYLIFLKKII